MTAAAQTFIDAADSTEDWWIEVVDAEDFASAPALANCAAELAAEGEDLLKSLTGETNEHVWIYVRAMRRIVAWCAQHPAAVPMGLAA